MSVQTAPDGRSTRWEAHRRARREELVGAALKAISQHGPGIGMEEIAAAAGTSKTVLYRHFADKEQLHLAVTERVDARLVGALRAAVDGATGFRDGLRAAISAYLRLVEKDPAVYRFVVSRSGLERGTDPERPGEASQPDPVAGLSAAVSAELARLIGQHLRAGGVAPAAALPWAHGLVGMVRAAADHWQSASAGPAGQAGQPRPAMSADELTEHLTDLAWGGLGPALGTGSADSATADGLAADFPEAHDPDAPGNAGTAGTLEGEAR